MAPRLSSALLGSLLAAFATSISASAQGTEDLLLPSSDPGGFHPKAVRHDRIVADAPQAVLAGRETWTAHLFDAASGQRLARIDSADAQAFGRFGSAVALDGSAVLVGSPQAQRVRLQG